MKQLLKRVVTIFLVCSLIVIRVLFSVLADMNNVQVFTDNIFMLSDEENTYQLSNPRILQDNSMQAGQSVTYDCIWFGSYPQTEVVCRSDLERIKGLESRNQPADQNSGFLTYYNLVNESEWTDIMNASYDNNGDAYINGNRYRRIRKDDAVYAYSDYSRAYYWAENDEDYHYYLYEPIKWRVLEINENVAYIISDVSLDVQMFNETNKDTWETCSLRKWLNSTFYELAFYSNEKDAIITSLVDNSDTNFSGASTKDKIFLLSLNEGYKTEKALEFGFANSSFDEAKMCTCSTYAFAMGLTKLGSRNPETGTCSWWTRTKSTKYNVSNVYTAGYFSYNGYGKMYLHDLVDIKKEASNPLRTNR